MNKLSVLLLVIFQQISVSAQTIFPVTNTGFTFNPDLLTVVVGDIVRFNVGAAHPVLEVSQATWNVNGSTALPGGFSFPSGTGDYTAVAPGTYYYICTAHISLGMKGRIVVNAVTGIEKTDPDKEENVYPNPADNYIIYKPLGNPTSSEIRIMDITGRVVKIITWPSISDDHVRIGVEDLKKGLYFIQVKYGDKISLKKFLKS